MKRFLPSLLIALLIVPGAAFAAGDPLRADQWALGQIDAAQAWGTTKGAGITIAVVDTGIDLDHPDLKSKIDSAYTCLDGSCKVGGDDDQGHGSHVAGIAAAATSNGEGIAGVAPSAGLMAVKALRRNSDGTGAQGDLSDVALGIRWAVDHGADVVNLSLGPEVPLVLDPFDSSGIADAVDYAWGKGAVVVAAAGNDSLPASFYTGTQNLFVVGATGPSDELASYSSAGAGVDVYAPGGDRTGRNCTKNDCIVSAWKGGGYAVAEGTSMAAPHVSGLAALLRGQGKSNSQTVARIRATTEDSVDGFPRVNAAKAVGAPAGGGGGSGTGGGGGKGGGGSGGGGPGGGSGGAASPGSTPSSTASPGASPTSSTTPSAGESGGPPQAQGTPGGSDDLSGGNKAIGLLVLLGIAGAVYASSALRRRGMKQR